MSNAAASAATGPGSRAEILLASFTAAGYAPARPAIVQPAEPFLDLSGEDIRKSLYLTTDATGDELCLRPDLTIPVARDYLASPQAGRPAGFCYLGPVFRYREGKPSEFLQAGVESFGRRDQAAADAEMLALALDATTAFKVSGVEIRMGDVALFGALIDALKLAPVWRRRLIKDFNRKVSVAQDLERLTLQTKAANRPDYQGVLSAIAGSDRKAALALVTDLMSIAGAANVGGRSTAEIADRFLEQSTLAASLPAETAELIQRFLAIAGEPDDALLQLRNLMADARIDIKSAIDQFESRIGFMAARGLDMTAIRFATAFGRGVDYYTGFEFELHHKGNGADPLVAGGRYDGLLTRLGSREPIPAVGFSVWIETMAQAGAVS